MGISSVAPDRALIIWHPASTPPAGYIKANGAAVSRTAYAWLFGLIGTTWGVGDGSTTFNVPDLRGEFLRGLDDGRGVDAGRIIASAQAGMIESHTHGGGYLRSDVGGGTGPAGGTVGWGVSIPSTGGIETRPRNQAGLYCIAYAP